MGCYAAHDELHSSSPILMMGLFFALFATDTGLSRPYLGIRADEAQQVGSRAAEDESHRRPQMKNGFPSMIVAALVAILGFSSFMPLSASAAQSSTSSGDLGEAFDCAILNGLDCGYVLDAQAWAVRVTAWKFPGGGHNDMADAFRHCAWMGALATRIGSNRAYTVGYMHEDAGDRRGQPASERQMDEWNNFIGAGIGDDAVRSGTSDTWGYVLNECESRARNFELYGLDGIKGNYKE